MPYEFTKLPPLTIREANVVGATLGMGATLTEAADECHMHVGEYLDVLASPSVQAHLAHARRIAIWRAETRLAEAAHVAAHTLQRIAENPENDQTERRRAASAILRTFAPAVYRKRRAVGGTGILPVVGARGLPSPQVSGQPNQAGEPPPPDPDVTRLTHLLDTLDSSSASASERPAPSPACGGGPGWGSDERATTPATSPSQPASEARPPILPRASGGSVGESSSRRRGSDEPATTPDTTNDVRAASASARGPAPSPRLRGEGWGEGSDERATTSATNGATGGSPASAPNAPASPQTAMSQQSQPVPTPPRPP